MKRLIALLLFAVPAAAQTVQHMDPPNPVMLQCLAANEGLWQHNQFLLAEVERLKKPPVVSSPVRSEKRLPCKKGRTRKNGICGRW